MARGRVPQGGKAPFCADCGGGDCHVCGDEHGGYVWLCGSCELLRSKPDAELSRYPSGLPSTWRAKRKQSETLFDG
jgi:Zn-finger protein